MLKVLIIEPHGDDALLSAYKILSNKICDIDIITLSGRSSEKLKGNQYLGTINNITYLDLEDIDYDTRPKCNTHEYNKMYKEGINVYEHYCTVLGKEYGDEVWSQLVDVANKISENIEDIHDYDIVLIPAGLNHPYHYFIYKAMRLITDKEEIPNIIYYAEKPYISNRYVRQMLDGLIKSENLSRYEVSMTEGDTAFKSQTFREVYPTEVNMLRFSSECLLKDNDVYLSKSSDAIEELFGNNYEEVK